MITHQLPLSTTLFFAFNDIFVAVPTTDEACAGISEKHLGKCSMLN